MSLGKGVERMDIREVTVHPCVLLDIGPLGPLPHLPPKKNNKEATWDGLNSAIRDDYDKYLMSCPTGLLDIFFFHFFKSFNMSRNYETFATKDIFPNAPIKGKLRDLNPLKTPFQNQIKKCRKRE